MFRPKGKREGGGNKLTTYTPGPWKASGGSYLPITAMVNGKSAQIGRAETCGQITDAECEANARLIAASPGLLEALKELTAAIHNEIMKPGDESFSRLADAQVKANKAIAQAQEGK